MTGASPGVASWLIAALGAGALVVAITELLGAVGLIAAGPVALAWLLVAVAVAIWVRARPALLRDAAGNVGAAIRGAPVTWGIIALVLALTLLTGLAGAPNVWDGLTYHLPRVERWVEQGHLGFWPTSVDRQLWMAPWSGYAALQFRLLTGGDRLAFLPSWLACLGLILLSARVVRQLGGSERQAAFGALLAATMPMVVLHASSVQTDLPAAFWVMAVASLVLEAWQRADLATDWRHATLVGLATSLAIATKGTVLLALLPWLLLYGWALVRAAGWRALGRPLLVGTCAVLVLNGAIFARNLSLFGDPLGDTTARAFLRLSPFTVNGAMANLLANLSLHLGTPWAAWNDGWTSLLGWIYRVPLQADPSALFPYFGGFSIPAFSTHESLAGSPLHLLLGVVLVAWAALRWRRLRGSPVLPWVVAGVAAVLLHGVLIRWQLFGARLQLASVAWLTPGLGMLFHRTGTRFGVGLMAVLAVSPAVMSNYLRPLVGPRSVFSVPREVQYFAERPELGPVLQRVFQDLGGARCTTAGLVAGYDTPEYLLRLGRARGLSTLSFEHLAPRSRSAVLGAGRTPAPHCMVVAFNRPADYEEVARLLGLQVRWYEQEVGLLTP